MSDVRHAWLHALVPASTETVLDRYPATRSTRTNSRIHAG